MGLSSMRCVLMTREFKVLQSCEKGSIDWAQIPATGTSTHGLQSPAPLLEIMPSEHVGHQH